MACARAAPRAKRSGPPATPHIQPHPSLRSPSPPPSPRRFPIPAPLAGAPPPGCFTRHSPPPPPPSPRLCKCSCCTSCKEKPPSACCEPGGCCVKPGNCYCWTDPYLVIKPRYLSITAPLLGTAKGTVAIAGDVPTDVEGVVTFVDAPAITVCGPLRPARPPAQYQSPPPRPPACPL